MTLATAEQLPRPNETSRWFDGAMLHLASRSDTLVPVNMVAGGGDLGKAAKSVWLMHTHAWSARDTQLVFSPVSFVPTFCLFAVLINPPSSFCPACQYWHSSFVALQATPPQPFHCGPGLSTPPLPPFPCPSPNCFPFLHVHWNAASLSNFSIWPWLQLYNVQIARDEALGCPSVPC